MDTKRCVKQHQKGKHAEKEKPVVKGRKQGSKIDRRRRSSKTGSKRRRKKKPFRQKVDKNGVPIGWSGI